MNSYFQNTPLKLFYLVLLSTSVISFIKPSFISGLNNPVAIGKFLNGNLPVTTPSTTGGTPTAPTLLSQTEHLQILLP